MSWHSWTLFENRVELNGKSIWRQLAYINEASGRTDLIQAKRKKKLRSRLNSLHATFNMREIVHIQAGQCGNQIGAKVSQSTVYLWVNDVLEVGFTEKGMNDFFS